MAEIKMMSTAFSLLIIGLAPFTEEVTLTCGNTFQHTEVQCTCFNSGGNGIEWLVNGDTLTTCFKSSSCVPDKTGYSFTANSSGDLYFLTITSHSYSQCGVYECRDVFSSSNKQTVEISISDTYLNMSWEPEEQIEPGNHTDGLFSVTSPCLFDVNVNDIIVQWFTVSNGIKTNYTPKTYSTRFVTTSCKECKGVNATQIQPSFLHNESENSDKTKKEVSFALKLYDRENQSNYKDISFSGMYSISVSGESDITCDCMKVVVLVVFLAWTWALCITGVEFLIWTHVLGYSKNFLLYVTLPWIVTLVLIILYRKERHSGIIHCICSFVMDVVFVVIVVFVCSCSDTRTEMRDMLDLFWASFVYLIVCVFITGLKYVVGQYCSKKCKCDKNVSHSDPGVPQSEIQNGSGTSPRKGHEEIRTSRPLPGIPSSNSRKRSKKERQHSRETSKRARASALPPISTKEKG